MKKLSHYFLNVKRITFFFIFFVLLSLSPIQDSYAAILTCSETTSASGQDDDPTSATINSFPCVGSSTITGATIDASIGTVCPAWYAYDVYINGILRFSSQCNQTGLDISAFLPLTSVEIRSFDPPSDGVSDAITLNLTVNLQYVNNDPCSAKALTVNCIESFTLDSNNSANASAIANPSCGNYGGGDIWYSFTAPNSGDVEINSQAGTLTDGAMALYSATNCNTLTEVSCDHNSGTGSMPYISATGLTGGDTYYLRFWDRGNDLTGTYSIAITDSTLIYCMYGDAVLHTPSGHTAADQCVRITDEINNQSGCAWSTTQVDFSSDFDYNFTLYFGNNINGADGCTFTFQNQGVSVCGTSGEQLGAGGLANSAIIEFDTYDNGVAADIAADHIAINVDGDLTDASGPIFGPIAARPGNNNLDNGNEFDIRIRWIQVSNNLRVDVAGVSRINIVYDFVNNVFGGDPTVYWGVTGSTGGLNNEHYFCPGNLPLPINITNLEVLCDNGKNVLTWSYPNGEESVNGYYIQRSKDGENFEDIDFIESNYQAEIRWEDDNALFGYYRIKQTTHLGIPKYSQIIRSKCSADYFKLENIVSTSNNFNLLVNSNSDQHATIQVVNASGKIINTYPIELVKGAKEYKIANRLPSGVYYIQLTTSQNRDGMKHLVLP